MWQLLLQLSADEVLNELVMTATASALWGKAGAVLVVAVVFMAVTSTGAGEMLAVSSITTYDVYREYINPKVRGAPGPMPL